MVIAAFASTCDRERLISCMSEPIEWMHRRSRSNWCWHFSRTARFVKSMAVSSCNLMRWEIWKSSFWIWLIRSSSLIFMAVLIFFIEWCSAGKIEGLEWNGLGWGPVKILVPWYPGTLSSRTSCSDYRPRDETRGFQTLSFPIAPVTRIRKTGDSLTIDTNVY